MAALWVVVLPGISIVLHGAAQPLTHPSTPACPRMPGRARGSSEHNYKVGIWEILPQLKLRFLEPIHSALTLYQVDRGPCVGEDFVFCFIVLICNTWSSQFCYVHHRDLSISLSCFWAFSSQIQLRQPHYCQFRFFSENTALELLFHYCYFVSCSSLLEYDI